MIRTQISFDQDQYTRAQLLAKQQGISLAELCRRGLSLMLAQQQSKQRWMALAGKVDGHASDSSSVDEVVYGREQP